MCIVQTFRYQSATIKMRHLGKGGVVQADYFGFFTDAAIDALLGHVADAGRNERVLLVRIDRAVMACSDLGGKLREKFRELETPGAVVCRPDQYQAVSAICSALSAVGVLRLVFLDYSEALHWADRLAIGLMRDESRLKHRCTPLIGAHCSLAARQTTAPANQQTASKQAGR